MIDEWRFNTLSPSSQPPRILIITNSFPFPPKDGKELPVSEIFKQLTNQADIDLLILNKGQQERFDDEIATALGIKRVFGIETSHSVRRWPSFFHIGRLTDTREYNIKEIRELLRSSYYDLIWVTPITCIDFVMQCKKQDIIFWDYLALGINDIKTYLYRDSIYEILYSRFFNAKQFLHWLKSFFISQSEKKILRSVDFIHLQTAAERDKAVRILGKRHKENPEVIVAPNGVKSELFKCEYSGIDSNKVLYMTHLEGARKNESRWFITKVWPIIKSRCPDAILYLVGKPPKSKISFIDEDPSVHILGYVEDLTTLFSAVKLSVVPTFHGTGLINRILDSFAAGLPTVSTPQAINTFPNILVNTHIRMGKTPKEFAEAVIDLYLDPNKCLMMSASGRSYAKSWPSWEDNAKKIYDTIFGN